MKIIGITAVAILIAGCASASKTYGPDGREAYALNCSGLARTWGACLERAGDICGERGYNVISSSSEIGSIMAGGASTTNASFAGGNRNQPIHGDLL
ncbi:hypothetical protein [Cupriavidus sp. IDO]|uniref:hypothetical protein n=1 Tax=Cupriavidus sp. IDO TaxID=1539142 RepID=UPI000B1ED27C|nr:hypothetical protein [Cupriavidus sp. IDO]